MTPSGPFVGLLAVLGLLGIVDDRAQLGVTGWLTGLGAGLAVTLLLAHGLLAHGVPRLGPADVVTLVRAILVCGVAALVADAAVGPSAMPSPALPMLVGFSSVALSLDAVDGRVARRTGTASALGARFDLEVDAFLILVLSFHVARDFGWWVVVVGGWRYLLLGATTCAPWLRQQLPARRWRRAVAATQGIVLTVVATRVLAHAVAIPALIVALTLLSASFVTEIRALWRLRAGTQPASSQEPNALVGSSSSIGLAADVEQWPG